MGLWLDCVDNIGELDAFLNEEDRNVVANNIPIALIGVELYGETADIANSISTASTTLNGGEA